MERSYQMYRVTILYDEIMPIITYFWIPVDIILHLGTSLYRSYFALELTPDEILILRIRLVLLILSIGLFIRDWSPETKKSIGSSVEWMMRAFFVVIANEQCHAINDDLFSTTTLIYMLSMAGLKMPTYFEYIFVSVIVVSIRPLLIVQRLSQPNMQELFWQAAYQNCLLFVFGVSISWKFQADRRQKWLQLPKSAPSAHSRPKVRRTQKSSSSGDDYKFSSIIAQVMIQLPRNRAIVTLLPPHPASTA
jgi:hypothetical protein